MRNFNTALNEVLAGDTVPIVKLVLLVRKDGEKLGFTSNDQDIDMTDVVELGVVFKAQDSVASSAIQVTAGTGVDNMNVDGILSDSRITDDDLLAGRYDDAKVMVFIAGREDPGATYATLLKGFVGQVVVTDGKYTAEVRSIFQRLKQNVGDQTSERCRVKRLFDAQCKVDPADFTFTRTVASDQTSALSITFSGETNGSGYYAKGIIRCVTGANAGVEREMKGNTLGVGGTSLVGLRQAFPFDVAAGDTFELEAGCQRRYEEDCCTKFNNGRNFHGEPTLPGNDKIIQAGRQP